MVKKTCLNGAWVSVACFVIGYELCLICADSSLWLPNASIVVLFACGIELMCEQSVLNTYGLHLNETNDGHVCVARRN